MNEQELVDRVKRGNAMFSSGDIQGLVATFADDIEWVMPEIDGVPYAHTFRGKQEVIEFFRSFSQNMQLSRYEIRKFVAQGDTVVGLGYYAGVAIPTGRPLEGELVHLYTYQGDKLIRFQQFGDTAAARDAFQPMHQAAGQQPGAHTMH
ncbi:hypothetical protein E4K72_20390 [Oxalobacteraceae bacterium OM1]|nr:hypothetical protein E4K72_20390 [Oxalobacteraceae bacterium OM1]